MATPTADLAVTQKKENNFWIPKWYKYSGIVNNGVLPLATPDRWRHEMAAVVLVNGVTVRLSVRGCVFGGRCFDCKLNLKSLCFCFWGQNTCDCDENDSLSGDLIGRLTNWRDYLELTALTAAERTTPQTVFPDMDVMFPPSSINRVPQQHMLPPVVPMLMQQPFRSVVPSTVFNDFISIRQTVTLFTSGNKKARRPFSWTESTESVVVRQRLASALTFTVEGEDGAPPVRFLGDMEGRVAVAELMVDLYKEWQSVTCHDKCRKPSKQCTSCNLLRGALKKIYKEGVRGSINGYLKAMLVSKSGVFSKAPTVDADFTQFSDERCRVVRVWSDV